MSFFILDFFLTKYKLIKYSSKEKDVVKIDIDHFDNPKILGQVISDQLGLSLEQIYESRTGHLIIEIPEDAVDFDFDYFRGTVEEMPYVNTARIIEL